MPSGTLSQSIARAALLSAAAGYVEIIGYLDFSGLYPGIMTGNTVQFGYAAISRNWTLGGSFGLVLGLFFAGYPCGAIARRLIPTPRHMLLAIVAADLLRQDAALSLRGELPLLALAMAMQGETFASIGGQSIQIIVVTINIIKCADALIAMAGAIMWRTGDAMISLRTAALSGGAWLGYSGGVMAGALARRDAPHPLLIAALIFVDIAVTGATRA
ncbi:YoaK family protein [Paraburkholderia sp. HD33-4]|uniref:YoaK family protein n=1 Tax=Paraburkholderia sp. HD33-4 TaxID=2883242 RepID=UPI001F414508|nr:YoaK family protein [Paraburkholderia sp. HD33-4]